MRTTVQKTTHKNIAHQASFQKFRQIIDRLYVSRKEGKRGLASIKECVDATIQRLKEKTKKDWLQLPVTAISTKIT